MNKRTLIQKIIKQLTGELEVCFRAAQNSRTEDAHEKDKDENKPRL
jgi:hypothetical protein